MKDSNSSTGLGFASVLGIVFIVLKLCKVINWSWCGYYVHSGSVWLDGEYLSLLSLLL